MNTTLYKLSELFVLFVLIPISMALPIPVVLKLVFGIGGFIYVLFVLLKIENLKFEISKDIDWKTFWKNTFIKLLGIVVLTTIFMLLINKQNLFKVVLNRPLLWIAIILIYSFFSVYPQELVYRTFFFKRYQSLLESDTLFIFINAILFSLAHILFRNALVMLITFCGGLLFAYTYKKTESTVLVSIEHAIYGSWLFTVGMGDMLGFPS
jgi:membrane protease YdiL (CAAX protease family)